MISKKRIRGIEIFIVFFPFLVPAFLKENNLIESITSLWCVASGLWTVLRFFGQGKRLISPHVSILILISIAMFISTLVNENGSIYLCLVHIAVFILPAFILEIYLNKAYYRTLYVIESVFALEIIVNFAIQLLYPKGLPTTSHSHYVYLLGMDNRFIFTYLTFLTFGIPLLYRNDKRFTILYYSMLVICNVSLIRAWSVGAMVGILLFDIFVFATLIWKKSIPISISTSTLIWVVAFFLLVIFQVEKPLLSSIVVDVLKKTVTFSGRTLIWNNTIEYIKQKPLFGHGILTSSFLSTQFPFGASHPHNQVLYYSYNIGVLGLFLQIVFGFFCLKKTSMLKGSLLYSLYNGAYLVLMIILLVDSWTSTSYYYMIFALFANPIPKESITSQCERMNERVLMKEKKSKRKVSFRLR